MTVKQYRSSGARDTGFSLAEILVAIGLFVVVVAITGTLIVKANQTTRTASGAAFTQAQMLDAVQRISREVAVSAPITFADATTLETVTIRDKNSVRTRFTYDSTSRQIRSKSSPLTALGQIVPQVDMATEYKVVAENITPSLDGAPLLTYFDAKSDPLLTTADQDTRDKIARVKINLNATVKGRATPLTMITSMGTPLSPSPIVGDPQPPLKCPDVTKVLTAVDPATPTIKASVVLTWPVQYGATSFDISRGPDWPVGNSRMGGFNQTGATLSDAGLDAGIDYKYQMVAKGPGDPSSVCEFVVDQVPATPVLSGVLIPPPDGVDGSLSWPAAVGATGYILQRDGATIPEYDGLPTSLTYVDPGLTRGVTYRYQVFATNASGSSLPSNVVPLTPTPSPLLLAGSTQRNTHTLTWVAVPEAVSYTLKRITGAPVLLYGPGPGLAFNDTGRPWNTLNDKYQAEYVNAAGTKILSNVVTLSTGPQPPPSAPTVRAYPLTYGQNLVSWLADSDSLRFVVSRSDTVGGTYTALATVYAPSTTYVDPAAALGGIKFYKVTAYNSVNPTPATTSPTGNQAMQFPATPVTYGFVAGGCASYQSGNCGDGTNHVAWTSGLGSTSYDLYNAWNNGAAVRLATNIVSLGYNHIGGSVRLGSLIDYYAVGVNACHTDVDDPQNPTACVSQNGPGGGVTPVRVKVYQRPPTPGVSVLAGYPNLATNLSRLSFVRNGDLNNPAGTKFCHLGTSYCQWALERSVDGLPWQGSVVLGEYFDAGTSTTSIDPYRSDASAGGYWGKIFDWRVRTWNPGGYSDYSAVDRTLTYPSPYGITDAAMVAGYKFSTNTNTPHTGSRIYSTDVTWGVSNGTGIAYRYQHDAGIPWTGFSGARSTPTSKVNPGTIYSHLIQAQANNGLIRTIGYNIQTAPATLRNMRARWQCKSGVWRIHYESVDTRPISGWAADAARWDLVGASSSGSNNSGTDGWHAILAGTAFAPNIVATGWYTGARPNLAGQGEYITVGNTHSTRGGVNRVYNYSITLSLGTVRGISMVFIGSCNTGSWKNVTDNTLNYPAGGIPRTLTGSNP